MVDTMICKVIYRQG